MSRGRGCHSDIPGFFLASDMNEELQVLWALHGLDERLVTLQAALQRHPAERRSLEQRVGAERQALEGFAKRISDLQLQHRKMEQDIEALQGEERKFQGQLPLVKKNEEYRALMDEIADRKGKRSDRETELLGLMEDEQRLQGERPKLEGSLRAIEGETARRLEAIAAEETMEKEQVAAVEAERRTLLERLPAQLRGRYERIRASREGRAVVPILKGSCGGCYRGQPPQALQEARRGDRPLICDGCGRILIWPPDAA
jgi:predicted  nucleic acid-binding Zn-ribbon protein